MNRLQVDGRLIGCPVAHAEPPCPRCGGGWPGTKSSSHSLVRAAEAGAINPDNMGCGTLVTQMKLLLQYLENLDKDQSPDDADIQ